MKPQPEKLENNFQPSKDEFSNIVPTGGGSVMAGGSMKSPNYVKGNSGWNINSEGDCEFTDGTFLGEVTATEGTIGGWTIDSTTLKSATSGERIELDAGNTDINLVNSSGNKVLAFDYGTGTFDPIVHINVQDDIRIGLKITTDSAITSTNHSLQIDCNATDDALFGLDIDRDGSDTGTVYGATITAVNAGAGSATALDLNAPTGLRITNASVNGIDIASTAQCIKMTQTGSSANASLLIDNDSSHANSYGIDVDRDANSASTIYGMILRCDNANAAATGLDISTSSGSGLARGIRIAGSPEIGIQMTGCTEYIEFTTDDTDPTSGGGAATGRIPIRDSEGNTHYLAYY